jgi:hypothetical protein
MSACRMVVEAPKVMPPIVWVSPSAFVQEDEIPML